ncbi:YceI family protein [Xanthomarina sp. F2636L]|uniref:YceI family protein n=1 Tax=Xanthomarina sp. F2636L TaxID=2996018 RepID=UPI00225E475A|nr:YceI family protein [Xanthomarina sp. F2636L]MCX7550129.1 YceI family protein [Xanthomarina sp. F2636L]
MKKTILFTLLLSLTFAIGCKNEKKEPQTEVETEVIKENQFIVKPETTSVKWTAYKTTDKLGVGGEFKTLNFEEKSGSTVQEVLNNLSFSIPVSSLFTNDATNTRDDKIKMSFFGAMLDTDFLKGTISYVNNAYVASLTMNGVTHDLPLKVDVTEEELIVMNATMNLKDWNALEALETLNKACFDLHKGADGISKTWEDVNIEISTSLKNK